MKFLVKAQLNFNMKAILLCLVSFLLMQSSCAETIIKFKINDDYFKDIDDVPLVHQVIIIKITTRQLVVEL